MSPVLGNPSTLLAGKFYQWSPGMRRNQGQAAATNLRLYATRRVFTEDTVTAELGLKVQAAGSAGAVCRLMIFNDNGTGGAYPGTLLADLGTIDATSIGEKMLAWSATISRGTALWAAALPTGWTTTAPQFVWLYSNEYGNPGHAPYLTAAGLTLKSPSICYYGTVADGTAPATAPAGMTAAIDTTGVNLDFILKTAT